MSDIKFGLELRTRIMEIEDELAEDAREFLEAYQINEKTDMEENQIRNLIQICDETRCLDAVNSHIRYQMGRSSAWRATPADGGEMFGEALIQRLDKHQKLSIELVDEFPGERRTISWHIAKLYLGYIDWYFSARKKNPTQDA